MSVANNKWAKQTSAALQTAPTRELKTVGGGGEPIKVFYQLNEPKPGKELGPEGRVLRKDDVILGIYEGSFITKKFSTTYYKIRTAEGLVAVPGPTQLRNAMAKVALNAEVQITYRGKNIVDKGNFAGKEAHSFLVAASDLIG